MDIKLPYQAPVKPYVWGWDFEIRDSKNRCVIKFDLIKQDYNWKKMMEQFVPMIAGLMNGTMWVENTTDGYRLAGFGITQPEVLDVPIPVSNVSTATPASPQSAPAAPVNGHPAALSVIENPKKDEKVDVKERDPLPEFDNETDEDVEVEARGTPASRGKVGGDKSLKAELFASRHGKK